MVEGGLGSVANRVLRTSKLDAAGIRRTTWPSSANDPWTEYALRTVRGGVLTSAFIVVVIALYFVLPGHGEVNRMACLVLTLVAIAITVVIALLPWRQDDRHRGRATGWSTAGPWSWWPSSIWPSPSPAGPSPSSFWC